MMEELLYYLRIVGFTILFGVLFWGTIGGILWFAMDVKAPGRPLEVDIAEVKEFVKNQKDIFQCTDIDMLSGRLSLVKGITYGDAMELIIKANKLAPDGNKVW